MGSIKGTMTEKHLLMAFAGESQARNRYTLFANKAKKEGFEQIAALFLETAEQERIHAKKYFSFLEGGDLEITATYPAGVVSDTMSNLKAATMGEKEEWQELYPEFARVAAEEGFKEISTAFKMVAKAEQTHSARYDKLISSLEAGTVFEDENDVMWYCRKCGYIHTGKKPPKNCPTCQHPQAYFERHAENY
jgi:rubrerythrin